MSKVVKELQLGSLKSSFQGVRDLVLLNVVGLNSTADNNIRLALRKKGIRLQMVKNTLARKVLGEYGIQFDKSWEGATTLAWGSTSVAELSKEIEDVVKKNDKVMKVKSAVADGQQVTFEQALKMPTREQAIARVVMLAMAPGARLAAQILGPGSQLCGQIKGIKDAKKDEAEVPAATTA